MSNETIYLPGSSVKERTAPFGQVLKIGLNVEKTIAFLNQHKNERGYVNLEILPRKTPSDKGETHSVRLDSWKPDASRGGTQPTPKATPSQPEKETVEPDEVPF